MSKKPKAPKRPGVALPSGSRLVIPAVPAEELAAYSELERDSAELFMAGTEVAMLLHRHFNGDRAKVASSLAVGIGYYCGSEGIMPQESMLVLARKAAAQVIDARMRRGRGGGGSA